MTPEKIQEKIEHLKEASKAARLKQIELENIKYRLVRGDFDRNEAANRVATILSR